MESNSQVGGMGSNGRMLAFEDYEKVLRMLSKSEEKCDEREEFQEREYQTYLVQLAKERNIIVCLPTGSGKTFIALQLTKDYLPEAQREGRKIIFLANTVPLVNQQAEYFRSCLTNTFLNDDSQHVECLTGDRNIDVWKNDKWNEVLDKFEVLVMTTQIFVDALNHDYITFEKVKLLILDECHHTVKDSAMNQVMNRYRESVQNGRVDFNRVPRILGLTATIILGKKNRVESEVREAEDRLCAKAVTYHEYEKVMEHSTNANAEFILYDKVAPTPWDNCKEYLFGELTETLAMVMNTNEKLTTEEAPDINHESFRSDAQRFSSKEPANTFLKKVVKEVMDVCEALGLYCAKIVAVHKRAYLQTVIYNKENEVVERLVKAVDSALHMFVVRAERVMGSSSEYEQLELFRTDKVTKILEVLGGYKSSDELRGLIFAERRIIAQALCWYLQELSEASASRFQFLKVGFIVGSATFGMDPIETRITVNEQRAVISKFRTGDYNLLVATRVLEEGLDVPACNLVMRIDKIQTYPSYVQSMGRARHKNSKFLGFIDRANSADEINTYNSFKQYNVKLSAYLRKNAIHADNQFDETEETISLPKEQAVPDFEPFPGKSPRISAIEAISLTQRYCQNLSCDLFVPLAPVYWWEQVGTGTRKFKAYVQFPTNSVIREIVEGQPQETKMLAKRSAALEACKLLYEREQLNEKLFPVRPRITPVLDKFTETLSIPKEEEKAGEAKIGTKKRTQWYIRKVADCFKHAKIMPGTQLKAYVIHFELLNKKDSSDVQSLYQFSRWYFSYCILTPVDLHEIPEFLLHVNVTVGNLVVKLEEIKLVKADCQEGEIFTENELERLRIFNKFIFGDLLKLKREVMVDQHSSILIAPLRKTVLGHGDAFSVDWTLMKEVSSIPDDFFKPPPEERRKAFKFVESDYKDAVVVPWYRPENEGLLYPVIEIMKDRSPLSKFEVNAQYPTYESYFLQKYSGAVNFIADKEQKLLKVKLISSNLNFFRSGVNYKKSQAERKDGRESVIEMIPELTNRHPLPGSLYIQTKFLPTVLHRINRLLCARDIIFQMSKGSLWWDLKFECRDYTEEFLYLTKSNVTQNGVLPGNKANEGSSVNSETVEVEVANQSDALGVLSARGKEDGVFRNNSKENEVSHRKPQPSLSDEYVLDFIHPKDLTFHHLERIKSRIDRFKDIRSNNLRNDGHAFLDTREWNHEKDTSIELENINDIVLGESLDRVFKYAPECRPTMYSIMQAITMEGSLDSVNLERLEVIGDSFLKYCVSRHIYSYFPKADEGVMTQWRSYLISNKYLYGHGKKLLLGEYLAGGLYRPDCAWLPPVFGIPSNVVEALMENGVNDDALMSVKINEIQKLREKELHECVRQNKTNKQSVMPDNQGYVHARVPDKSIADAVEALIGAYFSSGGVGAALHVMEKIGLRGPTGTENEYSTVPFGQWPISVTPEYEPGADSVTNHLPYYKELEQMIAYEFKNPWLLVEAFSHPCYLKNRVTNCYQRLEFLGDAVLDFLVTNHIYKANSSLNPGELTDLRAALVNNVTFGSLAVRYRLDTYLRHNQKALQDAIDVFVECQKANGHQVTGHFRLLSDIDCNIVSDVDCPKVLGDIFESLAGAVFVDSGMSLDRTWKVFYRLMKNEIDTFTKDVPKSPVRVLYEAYPNSKIFADITELVQAERPNRVPGMSYVALNLKVVRSDGESLPIVGMGKNKQSAKLAAAKYYNKLMKRNHV